MIEQSEAEDAVETAEQAPVQPAAPAVDLNDETLIAARQALAAGHLSPEDVKRGWNLSDAELETISKPAVSAKTISQELREIDELRKSDPKKYWSDEVQARSLALIDAQLKQKSARNSVPAETGDRLAKIDAELREIEQTRRTDRRHYDADMEARELSLLSEKERLTDGTAGLPEDVLNAWRDEGGIEHNLGRARETAQAAFDELDEAEQSELASTFDAELPVSAQSMIYKHMAVEPGNWRAADESALKTFASTEEGKTLLEEWGADAPKRLGQLRGRASMMLRGMSAEDKARTEQWVDNLTASQFKAVAKALTGR